MAARVPAGDLTIPNIFGLLIRSKLVGIEQARSLMERWEKERAGKPQSIRAFALYLVENRHITEYQAGLLLRGYAEGFFVGPYRILDRLGSGKMAGVYRAQHELGQVFALKVLPPSSVKDSRLLARFLRESNLVINFNHPNVVRGFQLGESEGLHYLAMEFLSGETLKDHLKRGVISSGDAARVGYQILRGLQHLHEKGIVHRDIKPENLMLVNRTEGTKADLAKATVKILDIGLGRAVMGEGEDLEDQVTETGVLLGTPDYMAPEQARNSRGVDIRCDLYSTGCVMYHMLTGQPPFPDSSLLNQMIRHATESPRPPHELAPGVPMGLEKIVLKLMEKNPEDRYADPASALKVLLPFVSGDLEGLETPESDAKMRPYFTWLEGEKRNTALRLAENVAPVSQPIVEPPSFDLPLSPVQGPDPTANVAADENFEEGVTSRELLFFVAGTIAGALATAVGCFYGLKRHENTAENHEKDTRLPT